MRGFAGRARGERRDGGVERIAVHGAAAADERATLERAHLICVLPMSTSTVIRGSAR